MTSTNIPFPCADYSFVGLPKTLSKILTKILTIFPNPFTFQQFMMFCWILFTFSTSIMVYFLTRAFETLILLFTLFPSLIIFRKIFLLHFSSKQSNKIPKWNLKFYQESHINQINCLWYVVMMIQTMRKMRKHAGYMVLF